MNLEESYRTLGLKPGASLLERNLHFGWIGFRP
jgi:hypothetical protein